MKKITLTQEQSDSLYAILVDNLSHPCKTLYKALDEWWEKFLGYKPYKYIRVKDWEFEIYDNPE